MFYYISGELAYKGENFVVVDVGGVGYKIYTSLSTLEKSDSVGSNVKLYTHLHVREDIFDIYGFLTNEELHMFNMLLSVSGVGTKAALSLLSTMPPSQLALSIVTEDTKSFTRAPGIGPKVAQRIVLELKDKVKNDQLTALPADSAPASYSGGSMGEALEALVVLGYSANEARGALAGMDMSMDLELIIKQALVRLMK